MRAGDRLQPSSSATTVRVRDGKTATTDGPFAETKEQLGGYYILDCKDLDEAIAYAAKIPSARSVRSKCAQSWRCSGDRRGLRRSERAS